MTVLKDFRFSIIVTAKNEDAARETFKTYLMSKNEERNIFNTFDFKVEAVQE